MRPKEMSCGNCYNMKVYPMKVYPDDYEPFMKCHRRYEHKKPLHLDLFNEHYQDKAANCGEFVSMGPLEDLPSVC